MQLGRQDESWAACQQSTFHPTAASFLIFSRATSALATFQRERRETRCAGSAMIYSNIASYWVTFVQWGGRGGKTHHEPKYKEEFQPKKMWNGFFFFSFFRSNKATVHNVPISVSSPNKQLTVHTKAPSVIFHVPFSPFLAQMRLASTFKIMEQTRTAHDFTKKKEEKPNEMVNISFNKPLSSFTQKDISCLGGNRLFEARRQLSFQLWALRLWAAAVRLIKDTTFCLSVFLWCKAPGQFSIPSFPTCLTSNWEPHHSQLIWDYDPLLSFITCGKCKILHETQEKCPPCFFSVLFLLVVSIKWAKKLNSLTVLLSKTQSKNIQQ